MEAARRGWRRWAERRQAERTRRKLEAVEEKLEQGQRSGRRWAVGLAVATVAISLATAWYFAQDDGSTGDDTGTETTLGDMPRDGEFESLSQLPGALLVKVPAPDRSSYLRFNDTSWSIQTGPQYQCLADFLPTVFNLSDEGQEQLLSDRSPGAPTCPPGRTERRDLRPETIRNFLLFTGNGEDDKPWWFVNAEGELLDLTQPEFDCLTGRFLVWHWVSPEELDRFPRENFALPGGTCATE